MINSEATVREERLNDQADRFRVADDPPGAEPFPGALIRKVSGDRRMDTPKKRRTTRVEMSMWVRF